MRGESSRFMRLREGCVETAVKTFTKQDVSVVFAANIHYGPPEYYESIFQTLENCSCVLYEKLGKDIDSLNDSLRPYSVLLDVWNTLLFRPVPRENFSLSNHELEAKKKENWKRCDIWFSQFFKELQIKLPKTEDIEKYLLRLFNNHLDEKYYLPVDNARYLYLLRTFFQKDPIGQVLLNFRDGHLIQGIQRELEEGVRQLGIFYGASHGDNIEKYLLEEANFKLTNEQWFIISYPVNSI